MQVEHMYEITDYLDEYLVNAVNKSITKIEPEEIDAEIEHDYFEDVAIPDNETKEITIRKIKRYQRIVNELKETNGYKCQLCNDTFLMDNGDYYCEAHHIKQLSDDGSQEKINVLILCPKHHRMFHYSKKMITIIEDKASHRLLITIGKTFYEVSMN